jgi:hypothetical protein
VNEYAPVPPDIVKDAAPEAAPLQSTFVCEGIAVIGGGWVIEKVWLELEQLFISFTVNDSVAMEAQ